VATAIPTKPEELEELLNDATRLGQIAKEPGGLQAVIKQYATNVMKKDEGLEVQIREGAKAVVAEMMNAKKKEVPLNLNPLDATSNSLGPRSQVLKNKLYNQTAPGAGVNKVFTGFGDYFRAIDRNSGSLRDGLELSSKLDELRKVQNSYGSLVPGDGGFLIPEQLRSDMLMVSLEDSIVRSKATVIPMESLRVAIPGVDSTSNVSSVFGGVVCYWTEEGAALTDTSAKFMNIVLEAKKLTTYAAYPNELPADASAFSTFLATALPRAIAFEEDYKFMQGSGVSEPLGYVNYPASVAVNTVSGQSANTIVVKNLTSIFSRLIPSSFKNAVWIASIDTMPQLMTMALSVGTGGAPVWLANGGIADAPPMTIYGRPVIFTEKTPTLGTTGDISLVDLSYYLVGDRQVMQASTSQDFLFNTDKTALKVIERVDGRPWINSAITPKNNSSATLTPFVQLSSTRT